MKALVIAIDGPSGVGKGTVARAVAAALQCRYVDSGAMYRAVAWKALEAGVSLEDGVAIAHLAAGATIAISEARVTIDGEDVTKAIRTPEIDRAASIVARLPSVRSVLVERQRELAAAGGLVMEGRDIGTVVFPDADVKIYLDASPEERARRRAHDPAHSGGSAVIADVATALSTRDELDRTRATSPLVVAPGATLVDTTGRSIQEVVDAVLQVVTDRLGRPTRPAI